MYYTPTNESPIRDVFCYESDFTDWLSTNLDRLDRLLGMKLKLVASEYQLGSHFRRPDILAEESSLDIPVVIENQLEQSDDDHRERLLIYAASARAGFVIWVAPSFRPEHIRTIDWINQNSFESFQLFAVRVFARQDSPPSRKVRFEVKAHPSQWSSNRKYLSWDHDYLDNGTYRHFWESLIHELRTSHDFTKSTQVFNRRYHDFVSGFSRIRYEVRFKPISETVSVSLKFPRPERSAIFNQLSWKYQEDIEHAFAQNLEWEDWRDSEYRKFHRVGIEEAGSIIDSTDETKRWMIDNLMRLRETFTPYLDKLDR